jgi:hypothetical protein
MTTTEGQAPITWGGLKSWAEGNNVPDDALVYMDREDLETPVLDVDQSAAEPAEPGEDGEPDVPAQPALLILKDVWG